MDDVLDIAVLVTDILERLGVRHMVAGSLASSLHGIPRATQDIDIVADLAEDRVQPPRAFGGRRPAREVW